MLNAIVLVILSMSILTTSAILVFTSLEHEMWVLPARVIYFVLASTALALVLYLYSARRSPHRWPLVRKLSLATFFFAALPSMLPIGFAIGLCVVLTGVWADEPGSHADSEILGPIGTAIMGLMCGPIVGILGVLSARQRTR